ncbi:MAG: DUF5677 domain-containing protein [Ruminococcus flavefaciens]
MNHSKLSDHVLKKGKFITPFHTLPNVEEYADDKSWTYGRMPEYLWIGLLFKFLGRDIGLKRLHYIMDLLHKIAPALRTARMSEILKLRRSDQQQLFDYIVGIGAKKALSPLTVFLTVSYAPVFAETFYCPDESIEDRCNTITNTMNNLMDHQSHESTDVRFVVLYFTLLSGNIHMLPNQIDLINAYPNSSHEDVIMRMARPTVRSMEQMLLTFDITNKDYLKDFWRCISEMTDCTLYSIAFPKEERDFTKYMEKLHKVFIYLSDLFTSAEPLDDKMNVLLGIATYSYKRLKEVYEHNLFNTISGRSCVRVIIEDYIMMKYLVANESKRDNIWRDFQFYGIGQYKLILTKHREAEENNNRHFDVDYIEALVNEFKEEEFIDMDTKYFDKQNIRLKAESVDEKALFGLYYDYDSAFEHGLWGAIREASLIKCMNPAHKYHCVPDIEDSIVLKSVMPDCIMAMNKTITYLNEIYGIPEEMLNEVIHFELKPIDG